MNTNCQDQRGFTLIELLVVISIIALLVSVLMPSLQGAREQAKSVQCLSNLRNLGAAMTIYRGDNNGSFWPYNQGPDGHGGFIYFWGSVDPDSRLVDTSTSVFMPYIGHNLEYFACPKQPWGSYVPQAGARETTTNYGYNTYYIHGQLKPGGEIPDPAKLFVFNDSAMYWRPATVLLYQNSTYLEPVTVDLEKNPNHVQTPTTQFRHKDRTQALCADGHAERFGLEGNTFNLGSNATMRAGHATYKLSFVGTTNYPHYAQ